MLITAIVLYWKATGMTPIFFLTSPALLRRLEPDGDPAQEPGHRARCSWCWRSARSPALYLLLQAEFVAMVQVIVYAGAIMVLFLFVIMYLNLKRDVEDGVPIALRRGAGLDRSGSCCSVEARCWSPAAWGAGAAVETEVAAAAVGNTAAIGQLLYSRYLFPFEITSVLLLVAMVGAVLIGRGVARQPRALRSLRPMRLPARLIPLSWYAGAQRHCCS